MNDIAIVETTEQHIGGFHRCVGIYERLGFVHEGVRRRALYIDGVYDDNVMMALLFDS